MPLIRNVTSAGPVTSFRFSNVLAVPGPQGPPGSVGPTGPAGPPGAAGVGVSPIFVSTIRNTVPSNTIGQSGQLASGNASYTDQGGGFFIWDPTSTATDNGIDIFAVTGIATGRWIRQYNGIYQAEWFGAVGDGVTDDTAALQSAFELVPAYHSLALRGGRRYRTTKPLQRHLAIEIVAPMVLDQHFEPIPGTGAQIFMDQTGSATVTGPVLDFGGRNQPGETFTKVGNIWCIGLVNGTPGHSGRPVLVPSYSDCGQLNTLGTFGCQFFVSPNGSCPNTDGQVILLASSGGYVPFANTLQAFLIGLSSPDGVNAKIHVRLNTSAGLVNFSSTTNVPLTGLTHVEFDYDGTHAYLYINGVQDATSASPGAGHIVQTFFETFTIGEAMGVYPIALTLSGGTKSTTTLLGGIKYGHKAFHTFATSSFTPPTVEPTVDGDHTTHLVVNFDPTQFVWNGAFLIAQSDFNGRSVAGDPVYLFTGHGRINVPDSFENVTLRGVIVGSAGVVNTGITVHDINYFEADHCVSNFGGSGLIITGGFGHRIHNCSLGGTNQGIPGQWAWAFGGIDGYAGALNTFRDSFVSGGSHGIVSDGGGRFEDIYVAFTPTQVGAYFVSQGGGATLYAKNLGFDDENPSGALVGVIAVGHDQVLFEGNGWLGSGNSNCPLYQIGGNRDVHLKDNWSRINTGAPGIIQVIGAATAATAGPAPIIIEGSTRTTSSAVVPILDPAYLPIPITGGPADVIVPVYEGRDATQNFTADADMTLSGDNHLFGTYVITDTAPHLTTARNITDPNAFTGKKRYLNNQTAQNITLKPGSVAVAAGKTALLRFDGTNFVRMTPDA